MAGRDPVTETSCGTAEVGLDRRDVVLGPMSSPDRPHAGFLDGYYSLDRTLKRGWDDTRDQRWSSIASEAQVGAAEAIPPKTRHKGHDAAASAAAARL